MNCMNAQVTAAPFLTARRCPASDALTGQECHGAIDEATGEYKYYMAGNPG